MCLSGIATSFFHIFQASTLSIVIHASLNRSNTAVELRLINTSRTSDAVPVDTKWRNSLTAILASYFKSVPGVVDVAHFFVCLFVCFSDIKVAGHVQSAGRGLPTTVLV